LSLDPKIYVCIPTYKRPAKLAALLSAIGRQTFSEPIAVLIGNNEHDSVRRYPELSNDNLPVFIEIIVATRGVSAVRNALIAEALRANDVEWLAWIDDDQLPEANWLSELVSTGRRHDADLVGGPVNQTPEIRSFWASGATDTSYLPKIEGPVDILNEGGNLLLSARYLRSIERLPFMLDYGRSGGEDYEFFLFARSRHAKIFWAPAANVTEAIPPARLTLRGMLWRQYSTSAYQARADRAYGGTRRVIKTIARNSFAAPAVFVRSMFRDRDVRLSAGLFLRRLAAVLGALVGLLGKRAERYGGP
jgi:glycosyltransferase involved in cell wall biosynthesis